MDEFEPVAAQQQKNAVRIFALLLVALLLPIPAYLYLAIQNEFWQLYALTAVAVGVTITTGAALYLARRGNRSAAVWLCLTGIFLALPAGAFLLTDFGIAAGLLVVLMTLFIGSMTAPRKQLSWLIIGALLSILLAAVIDNWYQTAQIEIPVLQQVIWSFAGGLLLLYVAIILRQFPTYPIATKLLLTLLIIALVPLAILGVLTSYLTNNALTNQANENLAAAVAQAAAAVDQYLLANQQAVQAEAELPGLSAYLTLNPEERMGSPAEDAALDVLQSLRQKETGIILSYGLLDDNGRVVLDTSGDNIGANESGYNHYRQPRTQALDSYVSPVEFLEDGQAVLTFSAPVRNSAGQIVGMLRAQLDPAVLQRLIAQHNALAGRGSYAILIDEYYLFLAHGANPAWRYNLLRVTGPEAVPNLQASRRLPTDFDIGAVFVEPLFISRLQQFERNPNFTTAGAMVGNETSQAAVTRLVNQPWYVIFVQPQSSFLAGAGNQAQLTILLTVVLTAMVALATLAVSQRLARPIRRLATAAAQMAAGNFTIEAQVESADEIGELAHNFNLISQELQKTLTGLELRVADRTRAVELTAQISRRLSTILAREELVTAVVEEVRNAFNYYHVHIYLLTEDKRTLQMVGGTGDAGWAMLAAKHNVPVGKGLVGRAAANNTILLVGDVQNDPNWLPNPLLPETKAELAVPITLGDQVLGVIDVQEDWINGLGDNDVGLIQTIALQVAIALRNAEVVAQTRRQAEREALINNINQQIQGSTNIEQALQIAAREVGRALGTRQTVIRLRQQE